MQDTSQSQSLDAVFTPRLVARLHRDAFDGTLRFNAAGSTRVLYFRRGEIASAASNAEDDRLHNILIRDGRLTTPQLEMARARQQPEASLGKTLIELGFLTPAELLKGARRQVQQILSACFALVEGTYQTHPGPLPAAVTVLGLPVRRLIFDALLESGDRQTVVREMGSMESIYRPTDATIEGVVAMRLDPPMEKVARLLDGRMTLRDISGRTALDDFTVSKVVLGLEILGLAEMQSTHSEPERTVVIPAPAEPAMPVPEPARPVSEPTRPVLAPAWPVPAAAVAARAATQSRRVPIETEAAHFQDDIVEEAPVLAPFSSLPRQDESLAVEGRTTIPGSELRPDSRDGRGFDADEMPPFPRDELPAFAAPPDDPPGWQVDPETGERVHVGPIELTFDGSMTPPMEPRSFASRGTAVAAVAGVVVAAALLAFFLRREPAGRTEDRSAPLRPAQSTAAKIQTAPSAPVPDVAPPAEPPPSPRVADLTGEPGAPPEHGAIEPPSTTPPSVALSMTGSPDVVPTGVPGGSRFVEAQRILDTGKVDVAAAAFRGLIIEEGPGSFTLQLMIACDPETIRHARTATGKDSLLFVVPFAMQGRSCYRACWGMYPKKAGAQAATATLPPYFATAGVSPVVVSFGRLVPPS